MADVVPFWETLTEEEAIEAAQEMFRRDSPATAVAYCAVEAFYEDRSGPEYRFWRALFLKFLSQGSYAICGGTPAPGSWCAHYSISGTAPD